jgi:glycosyltransferase involved in cell wall biosynthesis
VTDETSHTLCGRDIVLLASAPWRIDGKVNCHQLTLRLMRRNRVLFVESSGLRQPKLTHPSDRGKVVRRLASWASQLCRGPKRMDERLSVLSPLAWPNPAREALNGRMLARQINRAVRRLRFRDPIVWSFLPTAAHVVPHVAASLRIYHCVDEYAGNPGVDTERILAAEAKLMESSDLVFATSRPLAARLSGMHPRVRCIPNGAEVRRFFSPSGPPGDLLAIPQPRVGYVGNLAAYMLDIPLLRAVAAGRPEWSLVLIGPEGVGDPSTDLTGLKQLANVHALGPRPYDDIPAYLAGMDVCLIPFARNRVTESALPLKTCEYLAADKPVVATPLQALRDEPDLAGVIRFADTAEAFAAAIASQLQATDQADRPDRKRIALQYDWSHIYATIDHEVAAVLD